MTIAMQMLAPRLARPRSSQPARRSAIDLADRRNVEARLHAIAVGRAAVRAQIALSDGTLQAYDAALADAGAA